MDKPRIFISYSHDPDEHRERVLRLSERLRADGIGAPINQYVNGSPPAGWPRWMLDQLDEARVKHNLVRRLQRLGYSVDIHKMAA